MKGFMKKLLIKTILVLLTSILSIDATNQPVHQNQDALPSLSYLLSERFNEDYRNAQNKNMITLISAATIVGASIAIAGHYGYSAYQEYQTQRAVQGTGDIFMINERKFSNITPPNDMTREQWYRQKMNEQEEFFKKEILTLAKITPEEFSMYEKQVIAKTQDQENAIYHNQRDIKGTWVINYMNNTVSRSTNNTAKNTFTITTQDMDNIYQTLSELGYTGKVATLEFDPDQRYAMRSLSNLITIQPDPGLFYYDNNKIHMHHCLRHEISHIQHQDYLFFSILTKRFETLILMYQNSEQPEDDTKLKQWLITKGLTLNEFLACFDLITKYHFFVECRADLEGLFDLTTCKEFQNNIKHLQVYQGYPLVYDTTSICLYEKESRVAFAQDFLNGIANDFKHAQLCQTQNH